MTPMMPTIIPSVSLDSNAKCRRKNKGNKCARENIFSLFN
jgi:hypothetical protein